LTFFLPGGCRGFLRRFTSVFFQAGKLRNTNRRNNQRVKRRRKKGRPLPFLRYAQLFIFGNAKTGLKRLETP
jgi:hypothetical protein